MITNNGTLNNSTTITSNRGTLLSSGSTLIDNYRRIDISSCVADLDATISSSYSGDVWRNLINNQSYNVSAIGNPNHVGGYGNKESYFLMDGVYYFGGSNTTFIESMHKDNAKWTMVFAVESNSIDGYMGSLFGTADNSGDVGLTYVTDGGFRLKVRQYDGVGINTEQYSTDLIAPSTKYIFAVKMDDANNSMNWAVNSRSFIETDATAWTAITTPATYNFKIGAEGNGGTKMVSGTKLRAFSLYNELLTDKQISNLVSVYNYRHNSIYA